MYESFLFTNKKLERKGSFSPATSDLSCLVGPVGLRGVLFPQRFNDVMEQLVRYIFFVAKSGVGFLLSNVNGNIKGYYPKGYC